MVWDPDQYAKFRDERAAPFEDLVALASWRTKLKMVDLGCGTGELTAKLAALSKDSAVVGVDSSETMLARAQPLARAGLRFEKGRVEEWQPDGPLDVLFSHATLQWCDDHRSLFARLASHVAPGGILLVQMPSNHGHISHAIVREVAASDRWKERLGGFVRVSPVLSIDAYAELLHAAGLERPTVLEKVYGHTMADARGVLEWIKGTLLVPYLERLGDDGPAFLEELALRFEPAMPQKPYYYAFRRTLIAARRPS